MSDPNVHTIVFVSDRDLRHVVVGRCSSLQEAAERRQMSGDLVLDASGRLAPLDAWEFPWERDLATSYPKQCLARFGARPVPLGPEVTPARLGRPDPLGRPGA